MSRTRTTGGKGPGYDYWSRRPMGSVWGHGKKIKKICHGIERARGKQEVQKETRAKP